MVIACSTGTLTVVLPHWNAMLQTQDMTPQTVTVYRHEADPRGKKITCPGARDKLNFRQDKHIFSPNVRRASKKFSASLFDNIFRTSYLATGQVKI